VVERRILAVEPAGTERTDRMLAIKPERPPEVVGTKTEQPERGDMV